MLSVEDILTFLKQPEEKTNLYLPGDSYLTLKSYREDLFHFFEYLKAMESSQFNLELISRSEILSFKNHLIDHEYAPKSINRKLSGLSSFFQVMIEQGYVEDNPVSKIKRPKQTVVSETNDLSDEEVGRLLSLPYKNKMHQAVIFLLFSTGIRKGELIELKRKNIFFKVEKPYMRLNTKGSKTLTKYLSPICVEMLTDYLEWMENTLNREIHPEDWFFQPTKNPSNPNHLAKPLAPKSIDYIVKKYCKEAKIDKKISPHSARATYIGSALDNGADLYKVSQDVGHVSVQTTFEYNKRKLKEKDSPIHKISYLKAKT